MPLESKVTESGLSEHVGEPVCDGFTEQFSETGLSNALSRLRLTVEVALWPGLTVLGLAVEAEIEKSVLTVFKRTLMVLSPVFATTKSVRKAIDYAAQLARGLAAAHDKSIIHRLQEVRHLFSC